MLPTSPFRCPLCRHPLYPQGNSYRCDSRHSFDIARSGYVNLLPVQQKSSRQPGDSDDMLRSRQQFLEAGYYQSLAETLAELVATSSKGFSQRLIDMGCGEGYYLQQLQNASAAAQGALKLYGVDIAKAAVQHAAKRKTGAWLAVNSTFALPLQDHSMDTALSVFSPISAAETARILSPDGELIMVGPGEHHLSGLTALIYQKKAPHQGNFHTMDTTADFFLDSQTEIRKVICVQGSHIINLLKMTPYYWHCQPEQQAQFANMQTLETEIHFDIRRYRLSSGKADE